MLGLACVGVLYSTNGLVKFGEVSDRDAGEGRDWLQGAMPLRLCTRSHLPAGACTHTPLLGLYAPTFPCMPECIVDGVMLPYGEQSLRRGHSQPTPSDYTIYTR